MRPGDVRFGSKADMCAAKGHVRFTPESGTCALQLGMSALGQKRTYERHLRTAGGQAVRDIKPTHCSIRRCPSWRRQPGRATGTRAS